MKSLIALIAVGGMAATCSMRSLRAGEEPKAHAKQTVKPAVAAEAGLEARMHLKHAKDWAETLYFRNQDQLPTSNQELRDLAASLSRDVRASESLMHELKSEYGKNADAAEQIDGLEQRTAKIEKLGSRLSAECAKPKPDAVEIAGESSAAWHELDDAESILRSLLSTLKIHRLPAVPPLPSRTTSDSANEEAGQASAPTIDGFRPLTATLCYRSALDNTKVICHYGNTEGPLPETAILENLSEIERQLVALKKENAKLKSVAGQKKELEAQIEKLEQQQSQAQAQVDRLKKSVKAGNADRAQLKQTAANLYQQLRTSQAQQYQVMQQAGVQPKWYPRGMGPNSASYDPEEGW